MTAAVTVSVGAVGILAVVVALTMAARARRLGRRMRFAQSTESELLRTYLARQDLRIDLARHDLTYLAGAVVFIVGAGGTIGGRLAEELKAFAYRRLVLIDNNENGLYRVRRHLIEAGLSADDVVVELANVRDRAMLDELFDRYQPQVVFHYANYKSAALGGVCPRAFVRVNVAGTANLLDAVHRTSSVRTVVYISSDKAEAASTNYGLTKRVCELLVHVHALSNPRVRYACMRYCNILDAAGSFAVATFREQITLGEPVTVRRLPDGGVPNRYFMPIKTAAMVALVAGASPGHGDVYSVDASHLDPISIEDLVRLLARQWGVRNVERWVRRNVVYVDSTPGEKQAESLGVGSAVPASPLVNLHAPGPVNPETFLQAVAELLELSLHLDGAPLAAQLRSLVADHDPAGRSDDEVVRSAVAAPSIASIVSTPGPMTAWLA